MHGTSALHAPGRSPFGTAIVTAYARLSRFVPFVPVYPVVSVQFGLRFLVTDAFHVWIVPSA